MSNLFDQIICSTIKGFYKQNLEKNRFLTKMTTLKPQTTTNKEAEKYLLKKHVEKGATLMADKKEPGKGGTIVTKLTTNLFPLNIKNNVTVFRYEVVISGIIPRTNGSADLVTDITENARNDFTNVDRRFLCRDVILTFKHRIENKLNAEENLLYYDLSRTLFALKDMHIPENGQLHHFDRDEIEEIYANDDHKHFPRYSLFITPTTAGGGKLTLNDFAFLTNDVAKMDQSFVQFLNIATAQNVFNDLNGSFMHFSASSIYLMVPDRFGFSEADSPTFPSNSSLLGIGMAKSVRIIEGEQQSNGNAKIAVEVKVQKTPFHNVETVLEKFKNVFTRWRDGLLENGDLAQANRMFRGLVVHTLYPDDPQARQRFSIYGFSMSSARTENLSGNNGSMTVEQYFARQYNIKLTMPNAPLIIRRKNGVSLYYPMEQLMINDYQRVLSCHMTPEINQEMIKKAAIAPFELREQTNKLINALQLDQSEHLNSVSLEFDKRPMEVGARILRPFDVHYGDKKVLMDTNCRWRGGQYLLKAQINCWAALAFSINGGGRDNNTIAHARWNEFVDYYRDVMQRKGIKAAQPIQVEVFQEGNYDISTVFDFLVKNGVEFVLIGHPKGHSGDYIHHTIKYFELATEVVTQGVLIATVLKVTNKRSNETMENIVNKTNVKMGGLNYSMPICNDMLSTTLVIGFAINHPAGGFAMKPEQNNGNGGNGTSSSDTGGSETASDNGNGANGHKAPKRQTEKRNPSVVGYSANIGKFHNFEFIGDYKFQEPRRDEKLQIIDQIVCRCLDEYKKRENKYPSSLVIYRNACGEGFYQHLLTYEVPLLKKVLEMKNHGETKLTLIVVNKMQNTRFTPSNIIKNAKSADQNVRPGTVIDKGVVNPQWSEFYLASHRALQGTACVPRYTILVDDNNYSMDKLQEFTFGLCFGHQIVSSPISLPAPVLIGLEYAKRGRNNYNTDQLQTLEFKQHTWDNFDEPNEKFGFETKTYLSKLRVNA